MCPHGDVLPKQNEYHWLPTYSSLDSVKCVMGYTQRFTTIEHKVAPRSAWVQSLWSRLWVFSLCCFWHVYQLVDMLGCRSFFCFYSTNISYNWPPLSVFLSSFFLSLSVYSSTSDAFCLSSSLSFVFHSHSFLSMSNNSKLFCPASVLFSLWMRSCLKNSIHLVSWFPYAFWLIRHRSLPSVLWTTTTVLTKKQTKTYIAFGFDAGLYPSWDIGWFLKSLHEF